MSVYVGIDVHRNRSQVAVVTQDGEGAVEPERCKAIASARLKNDEVGNRCPAAPADLDPQRAVAILKGRGYDL